jgi:putative aldouronate transport system permease protein
MAVIKRDTYKLAFDVLGYAYILVMCAFCIAPFWLLISGSFTSEHAILTHGYSFWPREFTLDAYKLAMGTSVSVLRAYGVSIAVTVSGTLLGLLLMAMSAYVLTRKEFKYRNRFSFLIYFTMLFSGGMVPYYVLISKYFQWTNNYLALIVPGLMTAWLLFLLRNFITAIPESIVESAKIDGASEYRIFYSLILPLAKPGLATIGLFLGLQYWNDWYNASLFIRDSKMFPLQYFLQNTIQSAEFIRKAMLGGMSFSVETPTEALKMATAVIATGPIVFLYPFVQKYFVKGITVGAVKG